MKDYSLNKVSAKNFILNYIVMSDKLIVYYADHGTDIFDYSIEKEKLVLEKMKNQVLNSKRFVSFLNNKYEIFLKLFIDEILLFVLFVITAVNLKISLISVIVSSIIFPVMISLTGYKLNDYIKIKNDIKKHLLFLNNENSLNLVIRNDLGSTKGLDDELRAKVLRHVSNNFKFTLNTIDSMDYKEIKEVYEHVEKFIDNDKPKTLSKRRNIR